MCSLDIHHIPGLGPTTTLAGSKAQRLVPHASGMSYRECDQAQLTHLRADVGLPPTGPAGPSQVSTHPQPLGRGAGPCGARGRKQWPQGVTWGTDYGAQGWNPGVEEQETGSGVENTRPPGARQGF